MRRKVVLLMVISLGGCVPDQANDMAGCRTEADRFYHAYKAVDPDDPSSRYIIACMAARGYNFTNLAAACDSRYPLPTQAACYDAKDWIAWTAEEIRRAFRSK